MNRQIRRLGVALLVLFGALFVQLNYIQVVQADRYANAPGNSRVATRDFSRARGVLQTADGVVLARSVPTGGTFKRQRQYPEGPLFAHLAGYLSFTFGSDGLERTYNDELTGRAPRRIRRIGDLLVEGDRTANVTVTATKRLQQAAAEALGNRRGSIVAIEPATGAVLAMVSFPSYDPNPLAAHGQEEVRRAWDSLRTDPSQPMLPRAYRRGFPPGSTFKVVTAAAALDREPALATKTYPVLRSLDLPQTNRNLPNFGGSACGGQLDDLLEVSCNTGFAQLGLDLGAEKLSSEAADFGFNQRPPLDLPAVSVSRFPDASSFVRNLPALAQSAIGQQDVSTTPLQMALVAAGVANGGVIMRPHLLAEIRDEEGERLRQYEPEPWQQATSPETAGRVRDMMIRVVTDGTGRRAALPGVQVAAKTGTAQTVGNNAHAWTIAFAPAEAPRVAVAAMVESQPGISEATGGRVAAPIVRAVIESALAGP